MNFEETSNQYLAQLVSDSVFIDADLIGVKENLQTSRAIISVLQNGNVTEKFIIIYKENEEMTWKFLNPRDQLDYEIDNESDWGYPAYSKRIVAPLELIMSDVGIKMYGWFLLNNLPVHKVNETVHLYCNTILSEHQAVVDSLAGIITIEDKPV